MILTFFKSNYILFNYETDKAINNSTHKKKIYDGRHYLPLLNKTNVEKDLSLISSLRERYKEIQRNRFSPIYTNQKETSIMYHKRREENQRR